MYLNLNALGLTVWPTGQTDTTLEIGKILSYNGEGRRDTQKGFSRVCTQNIICKMTTLLKNDSAS